MTTDVIAREAELAVVQAFLDRPSNGPQALVLEGEPGIGKSTLWSAAVAEARGRFANVLVSRPAESERSLANVVLGDVFGGLSLRLATQSWCAGAPPPARAVHLRRRSAAGAADFLHLRGDVGHERGVVVACVGNRGVVAPVGRVELPLEVRAVSELRKGIKS